MGANVRSRLLYTLLTSTHVRLVEQLADRPVIAEVALVAVDAGRVVPAVLAHAASLVSAVHVDRQVRRVRRVVVHAMLGVPETVAR